MPTGPANKKILLKKNGKAREVFDLVTVQFPPRPGSRRFLNSGVNRVIVCVVLQNSVSSVVDPPLTAEVKWSRRTPQQRHPGESLVNLSRSIALLFALNIVDALVTIMWVRNGWATEGNYLMASLLDLGEIPFLAIKLGMGALMALVLLYGSEYRLAKIGTRLALVAYAGAIASHILTGFAVYGYLS